MAFCHYRKKHTPYLTVITMAKRTSSKLPDILGRTHNRPASFSLLYNKRADKPLASGDKCHKSAKGTRHNLVEKNVVACSASVCFSSGLIGVHQFHVSTWQSRHLIKESPNSIDRHLLACFLDITLSLQMLRLARFRWKTLKQTEHQDITQLNVWGIDSANFWPRNLGSSEMRHSLSALCMSFKNSTDLKLCWIFWSGRFWTEYVEVL